MDPRPVCVHVNERQNTESGENENGERKIRASVYTSGVISYYSYFIYGSLFSYGDKKSS